MKQKRLNSRTAMVGVGGKDTISGFDRLLVLFGLIQFLRARKEGTLLLTQVHTTTWRNSACFFDGSF